MSSAILHISDLHFVLPIDNAKTRYNDDFETTFIKSCKIAESKHKIKIKYLVVSGDIANTSKEKEYQKAFSFLKKIIGEIKIDFKNVLICPGNHDISWAALDTTIEELSIGDNQKVYEQHEVKFKFFKSFYDNFFSTIGKTFDPKQAVFDSIIDEEDKLIILGINSGYHESNQDFDHFGFIDKEKLQSQIMSLNLESKKEYSRIAVMHHNPKDLHKEKHNLKNWKEVSACLLQYFPSIVCGHLHGSDGEALIHTDDAIAYFVSVGSLSKNNIDNTFNLYTNLNNEQAKVLFYQLIDPDTKPAWQYLSEKKAKTNFAIKMSSDKPITNIDETSDWNKIANEHYSKTKENTQKPKQNITEIESLNDFDLITYIRVNKLFKTGHFHWTENFRSHGLIDINYLVSKKETLEYLTKEFYNKILVCAEKKLENVIIIAVGIECNIIGARLSALFPKYHYSFIPDPDKKDFSSIEREVKLGHFEHIIIIKDIIFEAESSKQLLIHLEASTKKNIFIFSIFYCGEKSRELNLFSDFSNVIFSSVCNDIEIHRCNYSYDGGLNDCPIHKYKLETHFER
ncbi:MAG: metallophosphoesterase [Bacteroidales bacterium]|jgi:predicted phosphodiesterase|nr:metallophosphoesterase [Bacteroidales bacterium]